MKKGWDSRFTVVLLLLLGSGLRLWGLTWSLPNRDHLYSYHPDEALVIGASHLADLWSGHFDPNFYNYGSLVVYLNSLLRPLAYALLAPSIYTDYLLGRFLTVLFGVGTIYLVYRLAREIGGEAAGWMAGLWMAIAPAHAVHSHYLTVDVPATFWVTASLYGAIRMAKGEGERWGVWAGIAAGLAAGTKYNAGIVLLAVLVAQRGSWIRLWKPFGACAIAFLLSTPGVWLWNREFMRDFVYEIVHTRTGHGLVFVGTSPGWIYHWTYNLRWSLGLPLLLLVSFALLTAIYRTRADRSRLRSFGYGTVHPYLVLLTYAIPYYMVIGQAEVKFLRYTLPLLPVLIPLLACETTRWLGILPPRREKVNEAPPETPAETRTVGLRRSPTRTAAVTAVELLIGVYTLLYTVGYVGLFSQTPPQDQAGEWLMAHAKGQSLGLTTVPWFYTPPVSLYNSGDYSKMGFYQHINDSPYRLRITGTSDQQFDADRLVALDPHFFSLSDFETDDPERLLRDPPTARLKEVREYAQFKETLVARYTLGFIAQNRPLPDLPTFVPNDVPPHDWLYSYPTIILWQKRY